MTSPGIVATGVRRSFGSVAAVKNVSLEAHAGRVTGLVGPNGSGKTTLLLMLPSLLAPDAGEIRIDGVDPVAEPQKARALLGWMPDALGAWGSLTARETLVVTGKLYGLARPEAEARAVTMLDQVGLDRPRRFARARALARAEAAARVWRGRSCTTRASSCSTSRLRGLIPRRGSICACSCAALPTRAGRSSSRATSSPNSKRSSTTRSSSWRARASVKNALPPSAATRSRVWRVRLMADDQADAAASVARALGRETAGVRADRGDVFVSFAIGSRSRGGAARARRGRPRDRGVRSGDRTLGTVVPRPRGGGPVNGARIRTIVGLELTQRVRSSTWYILLGVCRGDPARRDRAVVLGLVQRERSRRRGLLDRRLHGAAARRARLADAERQRDQRRSRSGDPRPGAGHPRHDRRDSARQVLGRVAHRSRLRGRRRAVHADRDVRRGRSRRSW